MADNTIDTLELKIESDAQQAANGIDRMVSKLIDLEKKTAKMESGFGKFANMFRGFSDSFKDLDSISKASKQISQIADLTKKLNKTSFTFDTGNILNSIDSIGEKIKNLSGVNSGFSTELKKTNGRNPKTNFIL